MIDSDRDYVLDEYRRMAEPDPVPSKNAKELESLAVYCKERPELEFWQAFDGWLSWYSGLLVERNIR